MDALERLRRWLREQPAGGEAALEALADVGELRRRLDRAELAAVRIARRDGRSWTEIATQLGITRQSAWEKWRDLDDAAAGPERTLEVATAEMVKERRRRGSVDVPNVVGLSWDEARALLWETGLAAMNAELDTPTPAPGETGWRVTDQSPESGAKLARGSVVKVWLRRGGGGAGDREPRQPRPTSGTGRAMRPEPSDEAVG
jgi:hypothetical protein